MSLKDRAMRAEQGFEENRWGSLGQTDSFNSYRWESQMVWRGDTKMYKVLVIEDEPSIAELLASIIEEYGYEVTIAFDGRKGFELARTGKYKLVITDNMLPYMTGRELITRLKSEPSARGTIVVLMSAVNHLANANAGVAAFLAKPFDISAVDQLVQRFLIEPDSSRRIDTNHASYLADDYAAKAVNYDDKCN